MRALMRLGRRLASLAAVVIVGLLPAGCDSLYSLVVNNYAKPVEVAIVDDKGGGYRGSIAPNECLRVMYQRPRIAKIVVTPPDSAPRNYSQAALDQALGGADAGDGVFAVNERGVSFIKDYKCR